LDELWTRRIWANLIEREKEKKKRNQLGRLKKAQWFYLGLESGRVFGQFASKPKREIRATRFRRLIELSFGWWRKVATHFGRSPTWSLGQVELVSGGSKIHNQSERRAEGSIWEKMAAKCRRRIMHEGWKVILLAGQREQKAESRKQRLDLGV